MRELEPHVLAGKPAGEASAQDHKKGATELRLRQATGTLVGFYSSKDEGVITHAGSKTHVHCVVSEPQGAGHVDHVIVQAGATIKFPMGDSHL